MNATAAIAVRDVIVDYPTKQGVVRALDCARLDVVGGTSLAVMGPSGCGKSTLLGLLGGLGEPTSGRITIGGSDIMALTAADRTEFRRSKIGIVYQADNLLPFLTVAEGLMFQLALTREHHEPRRRPFRGKASRRGGVLAADVELVNALLDRLGVLKYAERFPDELSGGQRQRVAVARAVIHKPAVLLADEPTGALDERNAAEVIDLLNELQRDLRATLVVVTHDPSVAKRLQRTVMLPAGRGLVEPMDDELSARDNARQRIGANRVR